MNEINEKIIETIKKLLARAEGNSNEHESKVCILKAQKLMAQNNISMSQVEDRSSIDDIIQGDVGEASRTSWWEKQLSVIIAKNFKVYVYIKKYYGKTQIVFLGRETDVNIAKMSFEFIEKAIRRLSRKYTVKHSGGTGVKNDYIKGFLKGLREQFSEQVNKNQWGLVLVIDKDVTSVYNSIKLKKGQSSRIKTNYNQQAVSDGYNTGKNFGVTSGYVE